ncbi:MAG: STT3 domain-containing protein [Candidatus Brocadiia bacterium]
MALPEDEHERRKPWAGRRRWACGAALVLVLAGAFLARARDAHFVFVDGRVLLPGNDPYYHLRRVQKAVADFPTVPAFDAYVNYPEGAHIYWPAGFDLVLAAAGRVAGARPWSQDVERVCAWAMPVLGCLVVVATYWFGSLWRGRSVGCVAAALVALLPTCIAASAVGKVDHDAAVVAAVTAGLGCWLAARRQPGRRRRLAWSGLAGLLLGGSLWLWPGSVVFVLLAAGSLWVRAVTALALQRPVPRGWGAASAALGGAALVVVFLLGLSPAARPWGASFAFLSGFHGAAALACGASPVLLWAVLRSGRLSRGAKLAWVVGSHAALAAAAVWAVPGGWSALGGGIGFMGRRTDVVVATAGEARGLFATGLDGAVNRLTWAAVAFPAGLLLVVWRAAGRRAAEGDWLVAVWAAGTCLLAVAQRRFAGHLAAPLALCLAALAAGLWRAAALGAPRTRVLCRVSLVAVTAVAAGAPVERWRPRLGLPRYELQRVLPALEWLRAEAPPGGDISDFDTRPPYAVMAYWHYGHWLTYLGQRANVACPFGNTPQHRLGLERARAFFGARSEAQAAALCRRLGVRYVLSTDFFLPLILADLGLDPRTGAEAAVMAGALQARPEPLAPGTRRPLRQFRLVHETVHHSRRLGRDFSTRLFELVPPGPAEATGEAHVLPRLPQTRQAHGCQS